MKTVYKVTGPGWAGIYFKRTKFPLVIIRSDYYAIWLDKHTFLTTSKHESGRKQASKKETKLYYKLVAINKIKEYC